MSDKRKTVLDMVSEEEWQTMDVKNEDPNVCQFTLGSPTVTEATFHFPDKSYTLPAVEHKQYAPLASLCAVVIELHNRIQSLEAELKGQDDE